MRESSFHTSVLIKEILELLQVRKGEKYIDATLGGGGYSKKILELGAIVLGIDQDYEAIRHVRDEIKTKSFLAVQGNFKNIDEIAEEHGFRRVMGIVYDLGVSGHQIDDEGRGFSFQKEGPLDMRMDTGLPVTASDLANLLTKEELIHIFEKYGEERKSKSIASAIVERRKKKAIKSTGDLVEVIAQVYGTGGDLSDKVRAGISKRVFQAFRIAVNSELENLEESLPKALGLLEKEGRLVVVSFHSLEDKIVKNSFLELEKQGKGRVLTKKPIQATGEELYENRRSRSAKLRAFEKI